MYEDTVDRIAKAIIATDKQPWQALAACAAKPGLMDHVDPPRVWDALQTCQACPVQPQCDQWVIEEPDYVGVAAGTVYRASRARRKNATRASRQKAS